MEMPDFEVKSGDAQGLYSWQNQALPSALSQSTTINNNDSFNSSYCPSPTLVCSTLTLLEKKNENLCIFFVQCTNKCYVSQMRRRARELAYTGDPLLLPIQSNEFAVLVRLLYRLGNYLNQKVRLLQ